MKGDSEISGEMTNILCRDLPEKLQRRASKQEKQKYKRERAREKKKEKLINRYSEDGIRPLDPEIEDKIEEWVDEDFDGMDFNELDEKQFRESLSGDYDIPIEKTGTKWYNHYKPLGGFIKSQRNSNNEHNQTTILIIRGTDQSMYRLRIPAGQETTVLSTAISKGYILGEVKVSHVDR